MVKTATLAICSIQKHFTGDVRAKIGILNSPSFEILGKTQTEVFQISRFMVNPIQIKVVITREPVIILT